MRKGMMMAVVAGMAGLGAAAAQAQQPGEPLMGADAYGDYTKDRPGQVRLINKEDLLAPYMTSSESNGPATVARPEGAMPQVPEGFTATLLADGLETPRVLRTAPNGDIFLAESGADQVRVLRLGADGTLAANEVYATGLSQAYGIAFYPPDKPEFVYVGAADRVVRFAYQEGDLKASGEPEVVIPELPTGGHWTRDIGFSPDGSRLYVAVGSASNVAEAMEPLPADQIAAVEAEKGLGALWETEENRAAVWVADPDGKNMRLFATGIRNCAGLGVQPENGAVWCATNERDGLGDNLPPDYVTTVQEGGFYGWPWYYIGNNQDPRHKDARLDLADKVTVPDVLIQPHSAPLGVAFYSGSMFPAEYQGSAFVTLHGSWNRGSRTGYKVVRLPMQDGKPNGAYIDFMTGFVNDDKSVWGRPVGVTMAQDGSLLVSEDGNGTIWRIAH